MNEAARSTDEWIASVRIATEPVIRPATTFSAISEVLETIETAAAREHWQQALRSYADMGLRAAGRVHARLAGQR